MGKKHLKLAEATIEVAPAQATSLSPARIALAAVIDRIAEAHREVQVCREAFDTAWQELRAAKDKLQALKSPTSQQNADFAADLIAAIKSGKSFDPGAPENASTQHRAEIAKTERDIEIWENTVNSCRAKLEDLQTAAGWSEFPLGRAIEAVIRDESKTIVPTLLDGLAELQVEILNRRMALSFLDSNKLIDDQHRDAVKATLRAEVTYTEGDHPVRTAWKQTLEHLKHDADTPLPRN